MKKTGVVFLDRDGVINEYPGHFKYVVSVSGMRLLPSSREALKRLCSSGLKIFVISNQAGVGKGLYSMKDLDDITAYMLKELGEGISFEGVYYCVHTQEQKCECRKPKPGLIYKAMASLAEKGYEIDKERSFFVGDSLIDVETGKNAGINTIMVFSGRESAQNREKWSLIPDFTASDLNEAADIILYK